MRQLTDKHPSAQEAQLGAFLFGPAEDVPHIPYQEINGKMVREAALKTKSPGESSEVDANMASEGYSPASLSRKPAQVFAML